MILILEKCMKYLLFALSLIFVLSCSKDPEETILLARANLNKGAYETARYHIEELMKQDSNSIEALMLYGRLEKEQKNYQNAIKYYDKVLNLNFDYVAAYKERAVAYRQLGLLEKAVADYARLIAIYSDDGSIYLDRGNVYFEMNKMDKACQDWEEAYKLGIGEAKRIIEKFCNTNEYE